MNTTLLASEQRRDLARASHSERAVRGIRRFPRLLGPRAKIVGGDLVGLRVPYMRGGEMIWKAARPR